MNMLTCSRLIVVVSVLLHLCLFVCVCMNVWVGPVFLCVYVFLCFCVCVYFSFMLFSVFGWVLLSVNILQ